MSPSSKCHVLVALHLSPIRMSMHSCYFSVFAGVDGFEQFFVPPNVKPSKAPLDWMVGL